MPRSQSPEWPASGGRGEPGALRLTAAASGVRAPGERQRGQRTQRPREGAARTQGCAPRPQRRHPRQRRQQAAATQPSGDGETSETRQARTVEHSSAVRRSFLLTAAGEPQRRSAERGNPTSGQALDTSPMNFPAPADAERRERSGAFEGQEGGAEEPLSNGRSSGLRGDVLEMVARSRDYAGHQRTVRSDAESHRR